MLRFVAATLLALCCAPAWAEGIAVLTVGDAEVKIALQDGYIRSSEKAPTLFATSQAALPPAMRLVEATLAESDLKRMMGGQDMVKPYLQVQAMRDAEALDFSLEEWRALQPTFVAQLGAADLDTTAQSLRKRMGEGMSEASGAQIDVEFGALGKPVVYSTEGDVIRFILRIPIAGSVNGQKVEVLLQCAGAALVLNKKLVMINTYLRQQGDDDDTGKIRAFLAAAVSRAQALNASDAGQKTKKR